MPGNQLVRVDHSHLRRTWTWRLVRCYASTLQLERKQRWLKDLGDAVRGQWDERCCCFCHCCCCLCCETGNLNRKWTGLIAPLNASGLSFTDSHTNHRHVKSVHKNPTFNYEAPAAMAAPSFPFFLDLPSFKVWNFLCWVSSSFTSFPRTETYKYPTAAA